MSGKGDFFFEEKEDIGVQMKIRIRPSGEM